ncbi:ETC complex I subunit conserved region-domain-containing protein [Cercophora scortea]|uniref:NADH dehydrogenase [ubiquinone] iron-sulfur protein 4, mitochondrial n=1 Tax=Cercophora scortea TaxID=314031 RepID=A0AAE0IGL4_9PEZI|nr:ETC complex I subunit conserved region-domain-containing protein [Cercophora scortea]
MSSSLRTASSAARTLRTASLARSIVPATRRFESSSSTSVPAKKKEDSPLATPSQNAPDYSVAVDKATSNFTPVPHSVQDGSEENILPAAILSGAPMELQARTVRIYKPAKPATQSGDAIGRRWRIDWDVLPKGHRWENPLMGWQSSADFVQGTHIHFKTKEDAIAFAEKQGYEYFVQEPNVRHFTPKAYANNFLYTPNKLKHIRTK